mgnify:CR=1 FL=1
MFPFRMSKNSQSAGHFLFPRRAGYLMDVSFHFTPKATDGTDIAIRLEHDQPRQRTAEQMFTFIIILVIVYILYRVHQRFKRQQGVIDRLQKRMDRFSAKDKKNM